jgi:hypothetical protein
MQRLLFFIIICSHALMSRAQITLASGEQPQVTADAKGKIRVVYGESDKIYFLSSIDNGKTFSSQQLVAHVPGTHLGMTRGPQLATSADYSLITAIDKKGNIHSFSKVIKPANGARLKMRIVLMARRLED